MIDTTTRQRLQVSTDGGAAPYIMVPEVQLAQVRAALEQNKIRYWLDEETLSVDGGPEIAMIDFGHEADPAVLQRLLDSIP